IYGVSGKVKRPGVWELPMGTIARDLLYEYAGGMQDGLEFVALLPGGASTDFWGPDKLDLALDFSATAKARTRMGTGTMIVLDNKTCPVGMVLNLEKFFKQESCGWCTPCREGLSWIADMLTAIENGEGFIKDLTLLSEQAKLLGPGSTFCALAPGAASPLQTGLLQFKADFERHIAERRCSYHV
ncbi:MAG: SLBB domain-containing protein, partial [bacterium]|nr:SLBB domain-containing protein [bacterium]